MRRLPRLYPSPSKVLPTFLWSEKIERLTRYLVVSKEPSPPPSVADLQPSGSEVRRSLTPIPKIQIVGMGLAGSVIRTANWSDLENGPI